MVEQLIKLVEGLDVTGEDPETRREVGGDIFVYQTDQAGPGEVSSIAFRRGVRNKTHNMCFI